MFLLSTKVWLVTLHVCMLGESGRNLPIPVWVLTGCLQSSLWVVASRGWERREAKTAPHHFGWCSGSSTADCVSCHSRSSSTVASKWNWSWFVSSVLQAGNALPLGPSHLLFPQLLEHTKCRERCRLYCPVKYLKESGFPGYVDSPGGKHNREKGLLPGWPEIQPGARAHVGNATSQEEGTPWLDCETQWSPSHTATCHWGTGEDTVCLEGRRPSR